MDSSPIDPTSHIRWAINNLRIDNLAKATYVRSSETVDEAEPDIPIDPRFFIEPPTESLNLPDLPGISQIDATNLTRMFANSPIDIATPSNAGDVEDLPTNIIPIIGLDQGPNLYSVKVDNRLAVSNDFSKSGNRVNKVPIDERRRMQDRKAFDAARWTNTRDVGKKEYTRSLLFPLIRRTTVSEDRTANPLARDDLKALLPSLSFSGSRLARKVMAVPLIDHTSRINEAFKKETRLGQSAEGRFTAILQHRAREKITLDMYSKGKMHADRRSHFIGETRKRARSSSPEINTKKRRPSSNERSKDDTFTPSKDFHLWKNEAFEDDFLPNNHFTKELDFSWIIPPSTPAYERNPFNVAYLRMNRSLLRRINDISENVYAKIKDMNTTTVTKVACEFFEPLLREMGLLDRKSLDNYQRYREEIRKNLREKDKTKMKASKIRVRDWIDELVKKSFPLEIKKLRKMSPQEIENELARKAEINPWEQVFWFIIFINLSHEFTNLDPITTYLPSSKIEPFDK